MAKRRWQSRIGLILLSLALVAILNPELRTALVIVDSLGLDLVVLLASTQLRAVAPLRALLFAPASAALRPVLASIRRVAATAGLYLYRSVLPALLYIASPRLAPLALGLLLVLCVTSQRHLNRHRRCRTPQK